MDIIQTPFEQNTMNIAHAMLSFPYTGVNKIPPRWCIVQTISSCRYVTGVKKEMNKRQILPYPKIPVSSIQICSLNYMLVVRRVTDMKSVGTC
jgi:hypothetical protein